MDKILEQLRNALNRLTEYFKEMEKGRRNRLIILFSVALTLVVGLSFYLSRTAYSVLYTDLRSEEAGAILSQLETMGVKHKTQGSSTILVDSAVVDSVRMQIAYQGYQPAGGFSFDIFERSTGIGSTDLDKDIYYSFQIQDFVRRTINTLEKIKDSSVIINFSSETPFVLQSDKKPATAMVVVTLADDLALTDTDVHAIYKILFGAVQGLTAENINLVDTKMRSYTLKEEDTFDNIGDQLSLQQTVQHTLQDQIINMLTPVLGRGRFQVGVNVKLNFDQESEQSVEFNPPVEGSEEGLEVSLKEFQETVRGDTEGGVAGFDPNGAASQYQEVATQEGAVYSQISREANMELNEIRRQIERSKGRIEQLTVSVVLDTSTTEDEEETIIDEDYTTAIRNIIAGAIGVNDSHVTVESMPFREALYGQETSPAEVMAMQEAMLESARRAELIRIGIIVGSAALVLLLIFGIVRTLRPKSRYEEDDAMEGVDYLAGDDILPTADALAFIEKENSNLEALEEYIEKSPESVAQLLRNWLTDDGR